MGKKVLKKVKMSELLVNNENMLDEEDGFDTDELDEEKGFTVVWIDDDELQVNYCPTFQLLEELLDEIREQYDVDADDNSSDLSYLNDRIVIVRGEFTTLRVSCERKYVLD